MPLSDRDDRSEEDNAPDGDDAESYKYGPDKIMECTICNAMVRKDLYLYCHSYRHTSGDDSDGGAHAEDHDPHRFVYCTECKRNVTLAQSVNKSCHTYCTDCGEMDLMTTVSSITPERLKERQLSLCYVALVCCMFLRMIINRQMS